jgi:hypothetical protein
VAKIYVCFSLPESDSVPELAPPQNVPATETLTQQTLQQLRPIRASRPPCFHKNSSGKNRSSRKSDNGQEKIPKGQKKQRRYHNSMVDTLSFPNLVLFLLIP